jgi:hypothetical protein
VQLTNAEKRKEAEAEEDVPMSGVLTSSSSECQSNHLTVSADRAQLHKNKTGANSCRVVLFNETGDNETGVWQARNTEALRTNGARVLSINLCTKDSG